MITDYFKCWVPKKPPHRPGTSTLQTGNEGSFEVKISILACHFTRSFIKSSPFFFNFTGRREREIWIEALDCNSLREIDALCVSYTYTKMMPRAHIFPHLSAQSELQIVFRAPPHACIAVRNLKALYL